MHPQVYVANLKSLLTKFGAKDYALSAIRGSYLTISEHTDSVVDASFAPDGTAIATASKDGTVKFFQVEHVVNFKVT